MSLVADIPVGVAGTSLGASANYVPSAWWGKDDGARGYGGEGVYVYPL